jgi:hypothetical protein
MSVPEGHPCSDVYAEHIALLLVEAFTPPNQQVALVVDCQSLLQGFEATAPTRASYRTKFAGFWQVAHHFISQVHKVESHMKRDQAVAQDQVEWWQGNDKADWLANQALPQYIAVEEQDFLKAAQLQKSRLRQICVHLSQVEAQAPMARLLKLHPRTKASRERTQATRKHNWVWHSDCRQCRRCGIIPRREDRRSLGQTCPGRQAGHAQVHPTHRMRGAAIPGAEVSLVFCKLR